MFLKRTGRQEPTSFRNATIIYKSIGLVQRVARQPLPEAVKYVRNMYETALTPELSGVASGVFDECVACAPLVGLGGA
jgi:hypothetical protein